MALELAVVPDKALVIRRGKSIVAASWFGPWVRRPYIYPFVGPAGREVTRLGHPLDPVSHSHHKSIWIGHHDVGGVDFWSESAKAGRIVQTDIVEQTKEGTEVGALLENSWQAADGREVLREKRRLRFIDLPREELALEIDLELAPPKETVVLGKTPFGLLGIRVARTLRVAEGLGGLILNSEEGENEAQCMAQHAVWCDYSGPTPLAGTGENGGVSDTSLPAAAVGIACFDHPANSADGTLWHVRDDGWMGPGITRLEPRTVDAKRPLRLRYRIEAHGGRPWQALVAERYRSWRRRASGSR